MRTRFTNTIGVEHPIVLGGMGGGTSPALVAAVSNAGGLGIQGCTGQSAAGIARLAEEIRGLTNRPFGLNLLLFLADEDVLQAVLAARPAVVSTAWPWPDQPLGPIFDRAHDAGSKAIHMVARLDEAERAAEAGADVVVAQGTEGGGHVGVMGTLVLVPQVVRAVAPIPVVAAGGVATGAGLAAALMLGAEGVLLGTRFLATPESPLPDAYKEAICRADGHDTLLTELPDVISGQVWPGGFARVLRTSFIQEWLGREGEVRLRRVELRERIARARETGDVANGSLLIGQDAGLIDRVEPAGDLVSRLVREAEEILRQRSQAVLSGPAGP
jgi:NAD(P)H-dependent flavin oxidoreductase YrpB (nitropropane dioxygenase family)